MGVDLVNNKRWVTGFLAVTLFLLILGAVPTIFADPYFHFHKPLPQLTYVLDNQRYQNDGILRNFSYDAVITGTSMTENFKTTQMDALFETNSVKVPYSGASFREIRDALDNAFEANPGIRYVVRGIDCNRIKDHKDILDYEDELFPFYLYDRNPFNDVNYVFNKQVLFRDTSRVFAYTNAGLEGTTFDAYCNWNADYEYGMAAVKSSYDRPDAQPENRKVTEAEYITARENIVQNFVAQARENPDTQFYYFFAPYSILWWDEIQRLGELEWNVSLMREASRVMLECENIHLFSFFDVTDLVCDLSYYKDIAHYSQEVNSRMLQWMRQEEHRLTAENYEEHWDAVLSFYSNYDYDSLFE